MLQSATDLVRYICGMLARENFSRPPSVSSMVWIHFWAFAKRLRSASLNERAISQLTFYTV
jgi:hypothetical protein